MYISPFPVTYYYCLLSLQSKGLAAAAALPSHMLRTRNLRDGMRTMIMIMSDIRVIFIVNIIYLLFIEHKNVYILDDMLPHSLTQSLYIHV